MDVTLNRISPEDRKNPPESMNGVVFGSVFSNHMFSMVWDDGIGWHDAEIKRRVLYEGSDPSKGKRYSGRWRD